MKAGWGLGTRLGGTYYVNFFRIFHLLCQFLIMLVGATYCKLTEGDQLAVGVHFCLHSTHYIHWDPCLPYLPAAEAHQAVEEGA